LIIKANEVGFLQDIHINVSRLEDALISYLLFADGTLIFCKPEESHLGYLGCILVLFEVMSGFKINLSKSVLISIDEVPELAHFFSCGVDYLPSSDPDFPLGTTYECKAVWEPVVQRFWKTLVG